MPTPSKDLLAVRRQVLFSTIADLYKVFARYPLRHGIVSAHRAELAATDPGFSDIIYAQSVHLPPRKFMYPRSHLFTCAALTLLSMTWACCSHTLGHVDHIALSETPPAVIDGFHREFPGLTLSHADRITLPDHTLRYELKFRDAVNVYHRKMFTTDGILLDTKIGVTFPTLNSPASTLPAANP